MTTNPRHSRKRRFVIAVTGASGIIYAERLLQVLAPVAEIHLIISETASLIARDEGITLNNPQITTHENQNLAAPVASGSFLHDGMVIIPCSCKTLAAVTSGISNTLITRSADVTLKERRPCILLLRENPLSRVHLHNMIEAHDAGATIMMANPPFYHHPQTIADLVDAVIARVLDHLGVDHTLSTRWSGFDA